jgi:hypothetical protein
MEVEQAASRDDRKIVNAIRGETMANGNLQHAVDIETSAGGLIRSCPGGLPALAGTRHEHLFAARKPRMRPFLSAALDRTDRIVSVHRSH